MNALLLLAAFAVGITVGRLRLGERASNWAHWLMVGTRPATRSEWRWWAAQPVFAAETAWLLLTHPRRTLRAWRHRHDPPPRSEPLKFDPQWRNRR